MDTLIRRLDDVLSEAVFFESSVPVYQFRIDDQVWTATVGEGLQPGASGAPTCVVEMSVETLRLLLEQHADPNELVSDGRLRAGGLNFDIYRLLDQFRSNDKTSRVQESYFRQCATSTTKKRRLVAMAEQAMLENTASSKEQIQRLLEMLSMWVDHRISHCRLGQWEKVCVPGLETTPWVEPAEISFHRLVEDAGPSLRREAAQFMSGAIRAPFYGTDSTEDPGIIDIQGWRNWNMVEYFEKRPENCGQFPETNALLEEISKHTTIIHGGFLILEAGAQIGVHSDGLGWGISYQYGVIVPDDCFLTVLDERRLHAEGRSLVFNDSFLHRAGNNSTSTRILFFVVCTNHQFTKVERESLRLISNVLPNGAICYPK